MNNPTAAMIVIGDEILSGRTRDSNMHYLAKELVKIGIGLQEVRIVSDVENEIIFAVNE
jgi:molybdopterin-biosynthesis enzyme MoeA-like protein